MTINCLYAKTYIFQTNLGVFKFDDIKYIVHYKGLLFEVYDAKQDTNNNLILYCITGNDKRKFNIQTNSKETYIVESRLSIISKSSVKLFKWEGVGEYNLDEVVSRVIRNKDSYFNRQGLSGTRLSNAISATNKLINSLQKGSLSRKADGSFEDATGALSSTGEYDRKKVFGIKGKIKENENSGMNDAASYLAEIINTMPQYEVISTENWEQTSILKVSDISVQ